MITVKVQQRYPVPVQVQAQNGIQVKAYQAGPPGIPGAPGPGVPVGGTAGQVLKKIDGTDYNTHWQNETGSTPIVGLTEVAFGAPVTGALTSDPNIVAITNVGGNPSRGYVQAYGAQVGNLSGYPFVRADQVKGFTFLEIEGNTGIGFYTTSGSLRGLISSDFSTKWYSGVAATDYSFRIDAAGAKIGPLSQAGVANNYAFEVQHWNTGGSAFVVYGNATNIFSAFHVSGMGVQVTYYLGEVGIIRNGFGIGEKMTWGDINARISTVMAYDTAYYSYITYTARSHQFTGYTSIVASNNPLVVFQDSTSPTSTGKFFKASNGDNTPVLRVNRGDGTTLTPGPNILSTISFGLSDGFGAFSSIDDRVLICAEYSSVFTPGNNATVFTDFFVQNYNAGNLAERFRVTPFGIRLPNGSAPASPVNGDIWFDGADLKMRIAGNTKVFFDVVNEIPAGLINGINATFTTAGNFEPGTEEVYLNGLKLVKLEDYNTTGTNQIDLYVAPGTGEDLIVNYKKA